MSLRINTNMSSLAIQNAMNQNQQSTDRAVKNVATGSRLSDPSADSAGSAIANQMQSEIKSLGAAKGNAEAATGFVNVAESALSEQSNILMRMRELSVQSASDSYSKSERAMMQTEYGEIRNELDRIAKTTRFGSQNLLDGTGNKLDFQVGTKADSNSRISYNGESNTTADGLEIGSQTIATKGDALDSLNVLDKAMVNIASQRSKFGAVQTRLESAQNTLSSNIEHISDARSKIADADLAKEVSDVRRGQILNQYQTSMLQQSNDQAGLALKLIG